MTIFSKVYPVQPAFGNAKTESVAKNKFLTLKIRNRFRLVAALVVIMICASYMAFGQASVTTTINITAASAPAGWTSAIGSGSYNWSFISSGSYPSASPHAPSTYIADYNSFNASSGSYANLYTSALDFTTRNNYTTTMTAYIYRDATSYNTTTYNGEGINVYINTSASLTSATLIGFVPRRGGQAISGSVSGTSTTTTSAWYQYTFTIPTGFNTSANYLIFKAVSKYGDDCYMDGNIVYTTFPAATVYSLTGGGCVSSNVGLSSSQTGWSYQLQVGGSNTGSPVSGTGSAISFGSQSTTGTYSVVATNSVTSATANMGTGVSIVSTPTISGTAYACPGSTTNLTPSPTGGTWASANTAIATVSSGTVTGVSSGNTTISYTYSGCVATQAYTVSAVPTLTGGSTVCVSNTTTLTPSPTGGTWVSTNTSVATVSGGVVTGVSVGSATISYTSGCTATQSMAVNNTGPASISGGTSPFCSNTTTSLTDATSGGTWSSSATSVATVNTSGVVTGVSSGNATITYTNGCGTPATQTVTVNAGPSSITGTFSACVGGISALSDATGSGTWSSSATAIVTVNTTGVITGRASGNATISYAIGGCYATQAVTVNSGPAGGGFTFSPSAPSVCLGSGVAETVSYTVSPTTILTESWESGVPTVVGTAVDGWKCLGPNNSYLSQASSGTYPSFSGVESGTYMLRWNSYSASSGYNATVYSPSFSMTSYSGGTVTFWMYRDAGYSTATLEGFTVYVNTTNSITGGTSLGFVPRYYSASISGSYISGNSAPGAAGWYQYTCTIPSSYNGATNYILFYAYSQFGNDCYLDNIVVSGNPSSFSYTWSGPGGLSCTACANPTITPTVTGTSTYNVIAAVNSCNMPGSVNISVNSLPTISVSPTSGCYGVPVTASGATTYTWAPNTSLSASTGATITASPATATTYTVTGTSSGCAGTTTVLVNVSPTITGSSSVCISNTTNLAPSPTGGSWASANSTIASVSSGGVVTGNSGGSTTISYTAPTGCIGTQPMIVNTTGPASISGGTTPFCSNATTNLTDATTGGTWSSLNTSVATVNSSGIVSSVSNGIATIDYSTGCGTAATQDVTVNAAPSAITGTANTCVGGITTLADGAGSGTWGSSATAIATVNPSGVVTGIAVGNANISYTLSSTGCSAMQAVTVNASPGGSFAFTPSSPSTCIGNGVGVSVTYSLSPVTILTESWESGVPTVVGTAVDGWNCLGPNNSYLSQASSGTYPSFSGVESGTYMLRWNSYSASSGYNATVYSPSFSMTSYSGGTVTFWMYRDAGYSTATLEGFTVYVNTTNSITGGTSLGFVPRYYSTPITGSYISGNSSPGAAGWYQYTCTIPSSYNGAANYILFYAYSQFGNDCYLDNIVIAGNPSGSSYTWSGGSGLSCTACANPTITPTVTGSNTYNVVAIINSCNIPGSVTVSVNPLPTITVSPSSGCYGVPVTASGGSTYTWAPNTSLSASTGATITASPITATTYTVAGTSAAGCVGTTTELINISPTISGSTTVCISNTTTLTPSPTGGSWASANGSIASVSGGVVTGNGGGTTTISYTAPTGCIGTQPMVVNTTGPASISGGTTPFCSNTTTNLTDATTGGTWSSFNTSVATVNATGIVSGVSGGTATINYSTGCGTDATQVITVNTAPIAITGTAIACIGSITTLVDSTGGGNWSSSAASIATVNPSGVVTGIGTGNASISYTLGTGCYVSQAVTINAGPAGAFSFSPTSPSACFGSGVAVTVSSTYSLTPATILTESWESGVPTVVGTAVDGWNCLGPNNSYLSQASSGTYPSFSGVESGTYMLRWNSYNASSGYNATVYSPSFSLASYSGGTVTFWMYRDGGYATYLTEGFTVYVNTTNSTAGGTSLGFVPRYYSTPITGSYISGSSSPGVAGWYQYTCTIPSSYNGATNYILFYAYSQYGNDCYLDNIVISGNQAPSYTWSGTGGGLSCTVCTNPTITPTVTGSNTYNVLATIGSCNMPGSVAVSVNPLPTVSISPTSGCSGVPMTASGASTYTWAPNTSLSASTGATITANPGSATTYTVTGASAAGCTGNNTILVNLTPALTASITPTSVCQASNISLNGTSSVGGATYSWSGPSSFSSTTLHPGSFASTTSGAYTLTAANGTCTATATSAAVTVYAQPTVTLAASDLNICSGGNETLTASPSGGFGTATYTWSGPGIATATGSTATPIAFIPTVSATTIGAYSVSVSYTGSGCNTAYGSSSSVTVSPQPTVTLLASDFNFCSGYSETLRATPSGGVGTPTFTWSGPGIVTTTGSTATPSAFTATVSSTTIGAYSVAVSYDGTGCNTATGSSPVVTVDVTPGLGSISTDLATLCIGASVTLSETGEIAPSTGSNVYTWSGPSGFVATMATLASTSFTAASTAYSGVYTLSAVYGENGCSAPAVLTTPVTVSVQPSGSVSLSLPTTVCEGFVETITASMSGGSGSPTFTWSGPGISSPVTTGSNTYTVSPTTGGAYTVIAVYPDPGCNTDTMLSSSITPTIDTWSGSTSTDWNDATNWSCGFVPSITNSILVPAGTTYSPNILAAGAGYSRVLTVASGVSFTIQTGATLNIAGNLTNNGTLNGPGYFVLAGTSAQAISGNGTVNNIKLNNSAGAYINTTADTMFVSGHMKLASGNFNTNGSLVLAMSDDPVSGPNVNGMIDPISGGSISGKVIIQQYVKGGRRAYRFWGTPFSDSIALSQLENYIDITGMSGAGHGFTPTASNTASAFWYHTTVANSSATGGGGDPGWKAFTWCNDSMSGSVQVSADSNMVHRFEGIRVYVRGSKGQGLDGATYTPNPVTVRQWGYVNTGTLDVQLQKGSMTVSGAPVQNYNQKSNPYPSPVDIGTVVYNAWIDSQLYQPYIYVWNAYGATAGMYITITDTSLTPYVIQANTSFQVRAKNNGATLHFTESNKATTPNTVLLKPEPGDGLALNVYDEHYHIWDMLNINFTGGATEEEDNIDAGKAVNPDLNFYSWSSDHHPLCRDLRPFSTGKVIPLGLTTKYLQTFIIKADNYSVPSGGVVYLHDKYLEQYVLLSQGTEYSFEVTKDPASQGDSRFELGIESTETQLINGTAGSLKVLMVPNPATSGVNITFSAPKSGQTSIRILTVEGVCVLAQDLGIQQSGSANVALDNLAAGIYMVELTNGSNRVVQRLVKE